MDTILRSAHVVPNNKKGVYYLNNFIDLNQFNIIYDLDFIANNYRMAAEYTKTLAKFKA